MTIDIQAIRERVNKATPGPWRFDTDDRDVWCRISGGSLPLMMTIAKEPEDEDRCLDFDFIAHARTDIPALLDEIERLRGALGWYAQESVYEVSPMSGSTFVSMDGGRRARKALAGDSA